MKFFPVFFISLIQKSKDLVFTFPFLAGQSSSNAEVCSRCLGSGNVLFEHVVVILFHAPCDGNVLLFLRKSVSLAAYRLLKLAKVTLQKAVQIDALFTRNVTANKTTIM